MSVSDPENTVHEEAAAWLLRLRARGELGDHSDFDHWLAADPAHGATFAAVRSTWDMFGDQGAAPELLAIRRDALTRAHRAGGRRWAAPALPRRGVAAGIAAALAAASVGGFMLLRAEPAAATVYQTGLGEQRTVTLKDGSRLSLDANTLVKVAYSRDLRLVELMAGRAHFEVTADPARPMTVRAGAKTIIAEGAAFTVERQSQSVVVTLIEGNVAVSDADNRTPATEMKPQQQLALAPNTPAVLRQAVDVDRAMAWREGKLAFDDETLADAAARMNNYSTTKIVVEGDAARSLRISGIFKAGDSAAFADAVKAYFPLSVQASGETLVIRPRG